MPASWRRERRSPSTRNEITMPTTEACDASTAGTDTPLESAATRNAK